MFRAIKRFCFKRSRRAEYEIHKCTIKTQGSLSFLPHLRKTAGICRRIMRAIKKSTLICEENPQSTEYFRSQAEILRVRKEHVYSRSCMIHPFSRFRAIYEMWMCLIWLFVIVFDPLDAAFYLADPKSVLNRKERLTRGVHNVISYVFDTICLLDIVITFFTGFPIKKSRKVIMKPLRVARNYVLSKYFITDVLAALPLDAMVYTKIEQRYVNLFGFLRIMRLITLHNYLNRTIEYFRIRSMYVVILINLIVNFLVFHWFACFAFLIPQIRFIFYGEILAESWVEYNDLPGLNLQEKYYYCLYRACGNLFCIAFEEFDLQLWEETVVTILTFIFGKIYIFHITVLILNYLLRQRSLEVKYFETISQVQAYMSQKQLPMTMQTRLLQFYDYKYNKKFFKERGINSLLSEKLRGEINLSVCSKLVQNVTLLAHLPQQQLEQIVISLKPEIYLAHDIIIKAGSVGDCMYFLASGTVGVWTPSGKEVCHLQDGTYFGEISLVFKDKRRTANIVAIETCEVYKLDRRVFKNCFKTNSDLYKMLEDVAHERMEMTQMFEDVHAKTFLELTH